VWRTRVDELFTGPTAELAKAHASRVGRAFSQRIEAITGPPGAPGPKVATRHGPQD
jgi:hemoglobin